MGEGGSIAQRQGGFRGLPGKLGSKHGWKLPLGGGQGFETRQAEGTCPRPRGAPEAGRLPPAEASAMPGGGGSRTAGARLRRLRVPSPPGRRPGTGSSRTDGRTDRPSLPSTPSPAGRGANTHSAGRRGAEGAAAQTHPGGCGASSVTVALPGTGGPRPRPLGLPLPGRCDPRARGVPTQQGGGGEGAPPAPGPGWGRRKRSLEAPACRREGRREAEGGAGPERPRAWRGAAHRSTLPPCPPHHPRAGGTHVLGWAGGVPGGDARPSPPPPPAARSWRSRDGGREQGPDNPNPGPRNGTACSGRRGPPAPPWAGGLRGD
ncbi:collagen alpha-1(II) chain-like [Acinonyx jubatus]|uniref:Collagen alpha-1(II) chain-like n=1 Tax=Acinonyx jubatus TaxID=32536 RepID=A0ABM3PK86_ACIJB|nr:collagen alpha-1(II) chain-like [Acinonyx jubatus]